MADRSTRDLAVRKVMLDFSDAKALWSPGQPEFSHLMNACSACLPELEPFLCKVVNTARDELPEDADELIRDATLFLGQEGRHSRMHRQFNETLVREGYTCLREPVKHLRDDFNDMRRNKGHKFSLAYAEAFETFGPLGALFFFDKAKDIFTPWDEPTVFLWLWHFAEEYEHRTVCNYLYKELYNDYWTRVRVLGYMCVHLLGWVVRLAFQLVRTDRENGQIPDPWRSRVRMARALFRVSTYVFPRLLFRGLQPNYDPAILKPPQGAMRLLAEASERYGIAEPPPR